MFVCEPEVVLTFLLSCHFVGQDRKILSLIITYHLILVFFNDNES